MYGHTSDPTRVYAYGAKPPRGEDAERVSVQIDEAWRYRNDLVALELERRRAVESVVHEHHPDLVEIDAWIEDVERDLEALRAGVRRANARRREKAPGPEAKVEARQLRARRKELREARKERRRQVFGYRRDGEVIYPGDHATCAALDGLDAHDLAERKRLRSATPLHWGSYLSVEQSLGGVRSGAPPRFARRATWGGKLSVQLQGGATWDELVAGHGQCRVEVEPLPKGAKPGGRRSRRPYCRFYLRVGSEGPGNRTPVWAMVRFVLHRPLPADGQVKWAHLVRRRVGVSEEWSVQFAVARSSWAWQDTTEAAGTAALNLGWRRDGGGLRVAYALGEDGHREELRIPDERLGGLDKASSLEGIRDREFALAQARLVDWLATEDAPDWLREATRTLAQWRAPARLAALALRWRDERFGGDAAAYEALEAWRVQDRHLCDWAAAERRKFRRWRDDTYRRFAARLRWRYARVVVEATDYRAIRRRAPAEEDDEAINSRAAAGAASPGRLREIIESGHPDVERLDPAGITTSCSICGEAAAADWDRVSEIVFRCAVGHRLDQDHNAAANLLAASGAVVA